MMRGLKYISWGDTTGYAVAGKAYVRALASAGTPLTWAPMLSGNGLKLGFEPYEHLAWPEPDLAPLCNRPLDYDVVVIHTVPEYYPYWLERERAPGRRFFGYTVFELDRIPPHWPEILNRLDGVIVPCRWNVETFRASGVTVPIHVVPHLRPHRGGSLDSTTADRAALIERLGGPQTIEKRLIFYTVGMWTARKSMDRTVRAFVEAFSADDPVALIVKTGPLDYTTWRRRLRYKLRRRPVPVRRTVAALCRRHTRPPLVRVIDDEMLSDGQMRALHDLGDVYVSLTRAEGFGLDAFEAAARGKPVVITRYGGQLEFIAPERSWHLSYEMVPVEDPARWAIFAHGTMWPEASIEDAVSAFRQIASDPAAARARAAPLVDEISERYSAESIVTTFRTIIEGRPAG